MRHLRKRNGLRMFWHHKTEWPSLAELSGFPEAHWSSDVTMTVSTPCDRCRRIYDQDCRYCHGSNEAKIIRIDSAQIRRARADGDHNVS